MRVIVGLGNPGKKYEMTRHNIGFLVVDHLAEKHGIKVDTIKHKALIGSGTINGEKVILVKPQTFMNLSGESVMAIMNYYKVAIEDLMVVYDDVDIDLCRLRLRKKGSSGSHNGMKNIIYLLKDDNFPRLRFGIGRPERDIIEHVLGRFSSESMDELKEAIVRAGEALETYIDDGIEIAMNKFNR
jgi:PTH1 family peptidyl-tRNA hydrolase